MKKKISALLLAVCCAQFISVGSYAAEVKPVETAETYAASSGIEIMSTDVIVKKYRVYNGRLQYRRWNQTKNRWVDAGWIDM